MAFSPVISKKFKRTNILEKKAKPRFYVAPESKIIKESVSSLRASVETNLWFIPWLVTGFIAYKIMNGKL